MVLTATQQRVFGNTAAQLIGRVTSSATTFFMSLLIAQRLGADGFGDFSKITAFVPFFFLLTDLGLNTSFLRLSHQGKKLTLADLLGLRVVLSFLSFILCLLILFILPEGTTQGYTNVVRWGIILYAVSILCHALITTANALFQQQLQYHFATISLVIGSSVSLLFLSASPTSIMTAVLSLLSGLFTTTFFCLWFVSRQLPLSFRFSYPKSILLLRDAAPLTFTLVFNIIYFRIDTIILALSRPTMEVGVYNLAYKFFEFPLVIPVFFMNSLFPLLLQQEKNRAFSSLIIRSAVFLGSLGIFCSFFVWFSAPLLGVFRSDFIPAIDLLRLLSISFPLFFLSNLVMWVLITKQKHKHLVFIYGLSMIINVLGNWIFTPYYGPFAAAIITIVGEGLVLLMGTLAILPLLRYHQNL